MIDVPHAQRVGLGDVVRYDVVAYIGTLAMAGAWLLVAIVFVFEGPTGPITQNQQDGLWILGLSGLAWLTFAHGRAARLTRTVESGLAVAGTVELSMWAGHWLRVIVAWDWEGERRESTFALPHTRRSKHLTGGDAVTLVVNREVPSRTLLLDVLFDLPRDPAVEVQRGEVRRGELGAAEGAGPVNALDLQLEAVFHTADDGTIVFLPWGRQRSGYVLEGPEQKTTLRKRLSLFWHLILFGGVVGMAAGFMGVDVAHSSCPDLLRVFGYTGLGVSLPAAAFVLWGRAAARGLPRYDGPPIPLPPHVPLLARTQRGEVRMLVGSLVLLGVGVLALGVFTPLSPCASALIAGISFACAIAVGVMARRSADGIAGQEEG